MDLQQWISILGVPSLATVVAWLWKILKKNNTETNAVKLGIQALLRAQMISDYNRWSEKGYSPIYARENFGNCWEQYHELGANGVMDDIHEKFMDLPINPSDRSGSKED